MEKEWKFNVKYIWLVFEQFRYRRDRKKRKERTKKRGVKEVDSWYQLVQGPLSNHAIIIYAYVIFVKCIAGIETSEDTEMTDRNETGVSLILQPFFLLKLFTTAAARTKQISINVCYEIHRRG